MSKKDDEFLGKVIGWSLVIVIFLPIVLIYFVLKWIIQIVSFVKGDNSNYIKYGVTISKNEKEQLDNIDNMDGIEFEKFMTALIIKNGYTNVRITKSIGDYGADILGENNGIKYAFQCKRFESKVGPKPIGEVLRGMNYYGCDKGVVITNNYFTKQAYIEAKVNNVELWDRDKVLELCRRTITEYQENPKVHKPILDSEQKTRLVMVIVSAIIVILGMFAIKEWYHNTMTKGLDENAIDYYKLSDTIYDIASEVGNYDDFAIELDKYEKEKYKTQINYIVRSNQYTIDKYDELLKNEVTKVYEKIRDYELIWNTIFGQSDCSNVTIEFILQYKKSENYNEYFGGIKLLYGYDKWKSSFEKAMNKMSIRQSDFDEMVRNFQPIGENNKENIQGLEENTKKDIQQVSEENNWNQHLYLSDLDELSKWIAEDGTFVTGKNEKMVEVSAEVMIEWINEHYHLNLSHNGSRIQLNGKDVTMAELRDIKVN